MKNTKNDSTETTKSVEDQDWKRFSVFLHVLLPIAGLALLWGQRGLFSKLLLQLDRSCVSVFCPSLSKREKLLKWASDRLPSTWSSQARTLSSGIPELWKDGSLLCTLINSVVPGACPNPHRHWRKPPLHAQALAYKYLGLAPMFTEDELSSELTMHQERNFIHYLYKLQEAMNKWPSKDEINRKFSPQYVARGMGLYTGEQHRKTVFYIYANTTTKKHANVMMYIRGPYGTRGKATVSPFHNLKTIPVVNVLQDQLEATKLLPFKNKDQKSFLKTISLDFTSLINDVTEKEHTKEIPIQIDMEIDRAKVTYIPQNSGMYEITLICEGELLRGSPYSVQVVENTSGKEDTFNTDCENVEEKITFTKRKILSKVIDCIDEKICIDGDSAFRIRIRDSRESSTESESDDLTITAITKKKDEILKTEINCTLEGIIEEINSVAGETCVDKNSETLHEIKKIAEKLKTEVPKIVETNTTVDSKHKMVKDTEEAQKEIVNLFQTNDFDVETKRKSLNVELSSTSNNKSEFSLIDSTKYIKDIISSTSTQDLLERILPTRKEDENNNLKNTPVRRIKSKISFEISPRSPHKTLSDPTSQICSDHIDPEVESRNEITLSEKRKHFSKQDSINIPDSELQNDFTKSKQSNYQNLSVLTVLDSIKQSRKSSSGKFSPLSSTVSLPNIASVDTVDANTDDNLFKMRKDYWERLSSRSSSNVSLGRKEDRRFKHRRDSDNLSETTKSKEENYVDDFVSTISETTKSKEDLLFSSKNSVEDVSLSRSLDTSLDDCTIIPLEERKKLLLKNMYKQETREFKKLGVKINFFKKNGKPKKEENLTHFSPVSERIETFNSSQKKSDDLKNETDESGKKYHLRSQFKKAICFFKNLEDNSKEKSKELKRRYSLDNQKKHSRKVRTGSLNLPNISDRFSINNLYNDVFGSKNGSFRGTPNKSNVVNALASFPKNETNSETPREDDISYNLFVNKKTKKRKGIKSLFDVNY